MIESTESQDEVIKPVKSRAQIKWLVFFGVIAVLLYVMKPTLTNWYSSIPTINGDELSISKVIRGDLVRDVAVSGLAVASNAPQLYSTETGQVNLLVKPGEAVEQNQIVAVLNSPQLSALIAQQKSTLEQLTINASRGVLEDKEAQLDLESKMNVAQSALNVAKRESQRGEISYQKKLISEVDWMKIQDTLADAKLFYNHAKKRVELAKERLVFESQHRDFLVKKQKLILDELLRREKALAIKAPVSGVVGNWLVAQKNTIAANTAIMTIVDLSQYEAQINVPEFYADDLGIGLSVLMTISGVEVVGKVIAISPEVKSNQVQVRASIENVAQLKLRQNQRINARIEFENKANVLMVKRGSFTRSLDGMHAFKMTAENKAEKIAINLGSSSIDYVEITAGAKEGDRLITSDYQQFSDALQLNIKF